MNYPNATIALDALLSKASESGDCERLGEDALKLIQNGADPNACSVHFMANRGLPFLAVAAEIGSRDVVKALLDAGARPSLASFDTGDTALHQTTTAACVRLLVNAGAPLDALSRETDGSEPGVTPLEQALLSGHDEAVHALLAAGANPSACNTQGTPLLHTAMLCGLPLLEAVLNAGADPDALDWHERSVDDRLKKVFMGEERRRGACALLEAARMARTMAPASGTRTVLRQRL